MSKKPPLEKIPRFTNEYHALLATIFKSRINLLCLIAIFIFTVIFILMHLTEPDFLHGFIRLSAVLFCLAIFFVNKSQQSFSARKGLAHILSFGIIGYITILNYLSEYFFIMGVASFFIVLFTLSFIFPWKITDVSIMCLSMIASFVAIGALRGYENHVIYFVMSFLSLMTSFLICVFVKYLDGKRRFESFSLQKEIELKSIQMEKELKLARKIHMKLIPGNLFTDFADVVVKYLPMHYIGGDYGAVHIISPDAVFFLISDITGHGVPAALLVNRLHTEVERLMRYAREPAKVLARLDAFVKKEFEGTGTFLSAFGCLLDLTQKELRYVNFGHPYQYLFRPDENKLIEMAAQQSFLGLPFGEGDVIENVLPINNHDKLILYTDGVIEAKGPEGIEYGPERFMQFIRENGSMRAVDFSDKLIGVISAHRQDEVSDDILVLTVDIKKLPNERIP